MAQTQIIFEGKDAALLDSYRRQMREQEKVIANYEKMAEGGRRAGQQAEETGNQGAEAFGRFAGQIVGITSVMGAAMAAIEAIKGEYQAMLEIQRSAAETQSEYGQSFLSILPNFAPDETVGSAIDYENRLLDIAVRRGATPGVVNQVAGVAASAMGNLSNEQQLRAIEATIALHPTDAAQGTTFVGAAEDIMNFTGSSPEAALGNIFNIAQNSRVTNPALIARNVMPNAFNIARTGGSLEEAQEFLAALTMLSNDEAGATSGSGGTSLAVQMQNFVPTTSGRDDFGEFDIPQEQIDAYLAQNTFQGRFETLQQNDPLRRQFIGGASFELRTRNAIVALLNSDPQALQTLATRREGILPVGAGTEAVYGQALTDAENSLAFQSMMAEQRSIANSEVFQIRGQQKEGLIGQAQTVVDTVNERVPWVGWDFTVEWGLQREMQARQISGQSYAEAAANTYRATLENDAEFRRQNRTSLTVIPEGSIPFMRQQIEILDRLANSIDQINQEPLPAQGRARPE